MTQAFGNIGSLAAFVLESSDSLRRESGMLAAFRDPPCDGAVDAVFVRDVRLGFPLGFWGVARLSVSLWGFDFLWVLSLPAGWLFFRRLRAWG